ncbi:MAG: hypothetical protein JWL90_4723 [Chthoniobacteraceae bacterium]|nr:hypothetical protein [Chthoniobacteraceae bacterium]
MNATVYTYLSYLAIGITMTAWVGRTLHRNGRIFLVDSFLGNEAMADSVNHLLLAGFYLINVGFITLAMKSGEKPADFQSLLEVLSSKVGLVLLVLGGMHFFNLYIFNRMRKRALLHGAPPPIPAQARVTVVAP